MSKKIFFNDKYGLTQSVLDGRKTMMRREIKLKEGCSVEKINIKGMDVYYIKNTNADTHGVVNDVHVFNFGGFAIEKAQYQVGGVLPIAQSYVIIPKSIDSNCMVNNTKFEFRDLLDSKGWSNKMFVKSELMPHHIRITNIRVERLQDISDEDCLREGIRRTKFGDSIHYYFEKNKEFYSAKDAFSILIDKVSGKGTWERNPYVFVYEFELVD